MSFNSTPVASSVRTESHAGQASALVREDKLHVLLADDDAPVRDFASYVLERQGCKVVAVEDGQAAVEAWPIGSDSFDLVILDVNMPRMGGYEAYQRLRRMHPGLCCLFVSGGNNEDVRDKLTREGNPPFLAKPFGIQQLIEMVRNLAVKCRL